MNKVQITDIPQWILEHKDKFVPPVCNKLLHNEQLKVFFVGGPNERTDYHIEQGEEFFYMLKGDMSLKIVERGVHKTIDIREGEAFMLPAKIPHSPQRKANTMGLVIERQRLKEELDGLRYYVAGTKQILYERWFHCSNLEVQLGPVIKEFFESNEYKTGVPSQNSQLRQPPYPDDTLTKTFEPIFLSGWLKSFEEEINVFGHKSLFDPSKFATSVRIYGGDFKHVIDSEKCETFVWQMTKSAQFELDNQRKTLKNGSSLLVSCDSKFVLKTQSGGFTLAVSMPVKYIAYDEDDQK